LIVLVVAVGTLGYVIIEGWGFYDSLYMTIITLSTVGFGEVHILTSEGKIFTIILILFGVGTAAYGFGVLGQFVVEGELRKILGKRKMEKQIKKLKNHYIICGYGRVGGQVCREFKSRGASLIVVENDINHLEALAKTDLIFVQGDATDDETLKTAGIKRAKGLVSTIASEADNVYVTLSARHLNPDLVITCRADSKEAERNIRRAGADRVVSPHIIGGMRMALATLRPNVVDFLQVAGFEEGIGISIEELLIKENSPLAGHTLRELDLRAKYGLTVMGIRKPEGKMVRNPSAETLLEPGDIIILLGESNQLERLETNPSIS